MLFRESGLLPTLKPTRAISRQSITILTPDRSTDSGSRCRTPSNIPAAKKDKMTRLPFIPYFFTGSSTSMPTLFSGIVKLNIFFTVPKSLL